MTTSHVTNGEQPSTSTSLIELIKSGDSTGWRRFVQLYGPTIYEWCRRAGLSADDAADVTQDVFRSVLRGVERFRRDKPQDSFRAWLKTVTRTRIIDFARSRQGRPASPGGTDFQQQLAEVPDNWPDEAPSDDTRLVHRALDQIRGDFSDQTWQAFTRTTFDGHTSAEAAKSLGTTPNAVRKARARVMHRLREVLGVDF